MASFSEQEPVPTNEVGTPTDPSDQSVLPSEASVANETNSGRKRRRRQKVKQNNQADDVAASYSRFSSAHQREEGIVDQQRQCHEKAREINHRILSELEFFDMAVSGTKLRRKGLDAMLRAAEAGEFQVLYFHSLSRLARESAITLPILKRLVNSFNVRIISVTEGLDSDKDGWEVIAMIFAMMAERFIVELAANVLRGQEGALLAGHCVGDYRFGYTSIPIPGSEVGCRGRNVKPRMAYAIDEVSAPWVVRIFYWFVVERRSIRWITRELNRRGAPKDHRATTPDWRHQQVSGLLASEKYIGLWSWGEMKNTRDPETGKVRQEPRSDEEIEKWERNFPHLQIIDNETFEKAQQFLEENYQKHVANRRPNGTLKWSKKGSADNPPRHLLSKLITCGECGEKFYTGGTNNRYMFCDSYKRGTCSCQTQLRRDRAERMILDEIGKRILDNPAWEAAVYDSLVKSWHDRQELVPSELAKTQCLLEDVEAKISRILDRLEDGHEDPDITSRLEQRRDQRRELKKQIKKLESSTTLVTEPTEAWLHEQLKNLGERLNGDMPAAAYALRDLVGGKIVVQEIRREGRQRHHLEGTFTIRSLNLLNAAVGNEGSAEQATSDDEVAEEIVITLVDPNPLDAEAMEAKELYDKDMLGTEIAKALGCSRGKVTKLLKHAFKLLGEEMPDSKRRRHAIEKKRGKQAVHERIQDDAMELYEQNLTMGEIAERLNCDRNTVTKAIKLAHECQGLEAPDGRTRRKSLPHKSDTIDTPADDSNPPEQASDAA